MKYIILLALCLPLLSAESARERELRQQLEQSRADIRRITDSINALTIAVKSGKAVAVDASAAATAHAENAQAIAERGVNEAAEAEASRKASYDTAKMISDYNFRGVMAQQRTILMAGGLTFGGSFVMALLNFVLTRRTKKQLDKVEINTNSMSERLATLSFEKGRVEGHRAATDEAALRAMNSE